MAEAVRYVLMVLKLAVSVLQKNNRTMLTIDCAAGDDLIKLSNLLYLSVRLDAFTAKLLGI